MRWWGWLLAGFALGGALAVWAYHALRGRPEEGEEKLREALADWHGQSIRIKEARVDKLKRDLQTRDARLMKLMDEVDDRRAALKKEWLQEGLTNDEIVDRFRRVGL